MGGVIYNQRQWIQINRIHVRYLPFRGDQNLSRGRLIWSSSGRSKGLVKEPIAPPRQPGSRNDEFRCPICYDIIKEAFITKCGHSFCYLCITKHLEHKSQCPTCRKFLKRDHVFPNFLLNRLLEKTLKTGDGENGNAKSSAERYSYRK